MGLNTQDHSHSDDLSSRFTYHVPKPAQVEVYQRIRAEAYSLALLINANVPDGREKSLAITKLEEVVFWANAGIARS